MSLIIIIFCRKLSDSSDKLPQFWYGKNGQHILMLMFSQMLFLLTFCEEIWTWFYLQQFQIKKRHKMKVDRNSAIAILKEAKKKRESPPPMLPSKSKDLG